MTNSQKRRITAEDLYKLQMITTSEISPDGKFVVYGLQRVEPETEKKYANLWLISTEDGSPRQITFGDHVDQSPKWSPDGTEIAFLSNRKKKNNFNYTFFQCKAVKPVQLPI